MNVFFNVCLWITSGKIAVVILPHSGSHLESIYEKSNMRIFSKEQILSILTVFFLWPIPIRKMLCFKCVEGALVMCILGILSVLSSIFFPKFVKRSIDYLCHNFYLRKRIYKLKIYLRSLLFFLSHLFVLYLFRLSISFALVPKKRIKYIEYF